MQTPIRYTVVNQNGQTVIRAVPVPRRPVRPAGEDKARAVATESRSDSPAFLDRLRRFSFR